MNHGYPPPRMPQGGPSQRLNELLDSIRTEFETESQRSVDYEGQSKWLTQLDSAVMQCGRQIGSLIKPCTTY